MKLSVIICIYNTSKALFEGALASIRRSTLDAEDYEILVIDDGSTEDYSLLIEKYSARCIKTENRGIFRARLLGIREAMGDHAVFVDSDDTVSFNYHRPMLEYAIDNECDIVFGDWAFHTDRTRYYCKRDSTISTDFKLYGDEILARFAGGGGREHSYFVLWNKMFSTKLLKDSLPSLELIADKIERYNYSEDTLICYYAIKAAKFAANIHTGYYFYRIHNDQTVNVISEERLRMHIMCMSETLSVMISESEQSGVTADVIKSFVKWRELMSRTHYSHAKANNYCQLYPLIKERYKVSELKQSTFHDNSAYSDNILIPENFEAIDDFLRDVYNSDSPIKISREGIDGYSAKCLDYIQDKRSVVTYCRCGARPPKPIIKFKNRIIMNKTVYSVGLLLFKKGSRIRAFLKKHI